MIFLPDSNSSDSDNLPPLDERVAGLCQFVQSSQKFMNSGLTEKPKLTVHSISDSEDDSLEPIEFHQSQSSQQSTNSAEFSEDEPTFLSQSRKKKQTKTTKSTAEKEAKKELLKQEREKKKKEKELAKTLRAAEKEVKKCAKPEECLKAMKIVLDNSLRYEANCDQVFFILEANNLSYSFESNLISGSITWLRTVSNVTVENNEVVKEVHDEIENNVLLLVSNESFVEMVQSYMQKSKGKSTSQLSLTEHLANIQAILPNMDVTCVTVGLDSYLKDAKSNKKTVKRLPKLMIEEAMVEVQLQSFVNFKTLDNMEEFGNLVARYTKAIAEAPLKKEKNQNKLVAFSWYADADSSCPVKIGKDGSGSITLWQQQVQQFQNVGKEVAEAIVSQYPSPTLLKKAYQRCASEKEAHDLLKDIVVRRSYGPLGTQRKIGPELSFKIYLFFTSSDGNLILQR